MNINKKSFIAIIIIGLLAIGAVSVAGWYLNSYHNLTVDVKRSDTMVTITRDDTGQEVKTIEQSDNLRLADGHYTLTPESTDPKRPLSDEPIDVLVDGQDLTVVVDPDLSAEYRQQILSQHQSAIRSAIIAANPVISDFFTIVHMEILGRDGDWAAVMVDEQVPQGAMPDTYTALLHLESGKWLAKTEPRIVLTSADFPDIPTKVLVDANQLYDNIEVYRAK